VSFVEVSPSTLIALNVREVTVAQCSLQQGRAIAHRLQRMPASSHIGMDHPRALGAADEMNPFPAILNEAAAVFGRVSVVQFASEVSAKERARGAAMPHNDRQRTEEFFSRSSGRRMTPVEHHEHFLRCAAEPFRGFG